MHLIRLQKSAQKIVIRYLQVGTRDFGKRLSFSDHLKVESTNKTLGTYEFNLAKPCVILRLSGVSSSGN